MIRDQDAIDQLLDDTRRFVRDVAIPNEDRTEAEDKVPDEVVAAMRELGTFGWSIPEEFGGRGLTSEELVWNDQGRLTTHAPSTYKIPSVSDCLEVLNCQLYKNHNVEDTILRSKAVGEPPLLLPFSVFFAIRYAIASLADHQRNPVLRAPATPESVLNAVEAIRVNPS